MTIEYLVPDEEDVNGVLCFKYKLLDLQRSPVFLRKYMSHVPQASNYMIENVITPSGIQGEICLVREDPWSSNTSLTWHIRLKNVGDDCYLWIDKNWVNNTDNE